VDKYKEIQRKVYNARAAQLTPLMADSDKQGFRYPIRFKEEYLRRLLNDIKLRPNSLILDIGCGTARVLNKICAYYDSRGVGIDIAYEQMKLNKVFNPLGNDYCVADAEELPFLPGSFDFIVCLDVLEHVPNPSRCIVQACRLLKKDGLVLFYAISKRDCFTWHWFLRKVTFGKLGVDRGMKDEGDHNREYFLEPGQTLKYCRDNGLKILKIKYIHCFFSLLYDELISFVSEIVRRPSHGAASGNSHSVGNPRPPKTLIIIFSFFNKIIFYFLVLLDMPWALKGYSNGFFILAGKK
jgi:ubiquinone/menaquinone biosynthesis C-methylase UbiE